MFLWELKKLTIYRVLGAVLPSFGGVGGGYSFGGVGGGFFSLPHLGKAIARHIPSCDID